MLFRSGRWGGVAPAGGGEQPAAGQRGGAAGRVRGAGDRALLSLARFRAGRLEEGRDLFANTENGGGENEEGEEDLGFGGRWARMAGWAC